MLSQGDPPLLSLCVSGNTAELSKEETVTNSKHTHTHTPTCTHAHTHRRVHTKYVFEFKLNKNCIYIKNDAQAL